MSWLWISSWIALAAAAETQTLSSAELRSHLTQTPGEALVAAWSVEELRNATQNVDVEGISLESMGRDQGRSWLEARKDCVKLVQRLDTDSWLVESFGACPEPVVSAPPPGPRVAMVNPEMVWRPNAQPQFQLGVQAGLGALQVWGPALGVHTGVQLGSPVSLGLRGNLDMVVFSVPDAYQSLARAGAEVVVELERPRNSFQLSGGPELWSLETADAWGGNYTRQGTRWTAALGWQHPTTLRNDKSRIAHGLLLRTSFSPRGLQTLSLQWTFAWDWRV